MHSLRPIILHHHIFKNAGTSIDFSLKKYFGNRWSTLEGQHARDIITEEFFLEHIQSNPELRAISSHSLRPIRGVKNILPILFIRHPILRARSVFLFSKKDETQPNHQEISQYSFPEYVEWVLDLPPTNGGIVVKNYQVVHLSDASLRVKDILDAQASKEDLIQAKDLIQSMRIYGIVEKFTESISNYKDYFEKFFKGIEFLDIRLNATANLNGNLAEQLQIIRNELGSSSYKKLNEFNNLDLSLYEYAQSNF